MSLQQRLYVSPFRDPKLFALRMLQAHNRATNLEGNECSDCFG